MKIKVQIKGDEHFIVRLLKGLKIDVYSIKHISNKSIYKIKEEDLKRIPKNLIVKRSNTLIEKLVINKYFIMSLVIGVFMIILFSNIIFSIKIIHNDKHIRMITKNELDKYGLKVLTFKKSYKELEQIKKKILNDYKNEYEWIEIIPRGMSYIVRIEKKVLTIPKKEKDSCDIVSTKDAIISNITTFKGQNVLDIGDYVKKGDTIISGKIMFKDEIKEIVCAKGFVRGNIWYSSVIKYPLYEYKKEYTGKKSYNIELVLNNKKITIFNVHFKNYKTKRKLLLKKNNIKIYYHTNYEYRLEKIKISRNKATKKALLLSKKRLLERLEPSSRVIEQKVLQSDKYNSIINMTVFYSVDEPISKQKDIRIVEDKREEG